MKIIQYEEKYKLDCQNVLLKAVPKNQVKTKKGKLANLMLYCNFYLETSPKTCFMAVNEQDEAVGYVICHPCFKTFEKEFKENYLKKLYKISMRAGLLRSIMFIIEKRFAKVYNAHLHIDILPNYQRMGLGHKLIDALKAKLIEDNVNGVYLIVGNINKKGVNFYKKYGFKKHASLMGQATVFGLQSKLNK